METNQEENQPTVFLQKHDPPQKEGQHCFVLKCVKIKPNPQIWPYLSTRVARLAGLDDGRLFRLPVAGMTVTGR